MCVVACPRHPGGHERGVPEVWLCGFSAHPQGEPRKRTGSTVLNLLNLKVFSVYLRFMLILKVFVGFFNFTTLMQCSLLYSPGNHRMTLDGFQLLC